MKYTYSCIAVDFDHTLARHTDEMVGMFDIIEKAGINREVALRHYQELRFTRGFSPEKLLKLAEQGGASFDHSSLVRQCEEWLLETLQSYPETMESISLWRASGLPVVVVTAGDDRLQRKKIAATGILTDDIIVVSRVGDKVSALKSLLKRYGRQIIFIDDKALELDTLREDGVHPEDILTLRIDRGDSPHRSGNARFEHAVIRTLHDIPLLS